MAKILLYDLEITPILGWVYEMYDANVIKVEEYPRILCFAYQWWPDGRVESWSMPDFHEYDELDDYYVVEKLWGLLNAADIVVAHNAAKFDNRVANARFIDQGFDPPSPYKTVDTLKMARRHFAFGSNSLAALSERLGIGRKAKNTHAQLWHDCVKGDMDAWKKMVKYCEKDVKLLAGVYETLLPFMSSHPNISVLNGEMSGCPKCGSTKLQSRGFAHTNVSTFRRFQCQSCGGWSRVRVSEKERPELVGV